MVRDLVIGLFGLLIWAWVAFVAISNGGFPFPDTADGWAWGAMVIIGCASLAALLFME